MTDVNTITQGEDDTMKIIAAFNSVFEKARDSIIDASRLAKEVEAVRNELNAIRTEMAELHARNTQLDEQLTLVRQQRDEALAEANTWRNAHDLLNNAHEVLKVDHATLTNAHNETLYDLAEAQRKQNELSYERDQAMDELHRTKEQLAKVQGQIGELHKFFNPPQPEPTPLPEQAAPVQVKEAIGW